MIWDRLFRNRRRNNEAAAAAGEAIATGSDDLAARTEQLRRSLTGGFEDVDRISVLYSEYAERSEPFPLDLEERSLRLILDSAGPDNIDAMLRLEKVLQLQGKTVPPDLIGRIEAGLPQVEEIVNALAQGTVERTRVMDALKRCEREGRPAPPLLEKVMLEAFLADDPERIDLKRRLVTVMKDLGLSPNEDLAAEVRDSYLDEERKTDFQESMQEYGEKVGFKDMEAEFFEDLEKVKSYTMTSVERLYSLWDTVRYVERAGLEGDFLEAGVWRGGSVMLMALALQRFGGNRTLWLYDTFTGLPQPDEALDVDVLGNRAIDGWKSRSSGDGFAYWAYADEVDVSTNVARTGHPEDRTRLVKGKVEDTIPGIMPERIALLRIDTDWHSSYKHALPYLYDRVVRGGVIIFDDYGHFLGARKAVDEFIAERAIASPLVRVDYSCRLMIKL